MVAIWRYTKFDMTYSFIKGGEMTSGNAEVRKIKVKRLSPFVSDTVESSIFCGIADESKADSQDVLGRVAYNIVYNLSFIGELILFLVMAGILGLVAYFLFSALSNQFLEVEYLEVGSHKKVTIWTISRM